jgi:hypothetical protein
LGVSEQQLPYGGGAEESARGLSFARRFQRHADWIVQAGRSPLCAALLTAAAADIEAGGTVAALFDGVDAPPGAVPQLRLLAALHELVLADEAPTLAEFYPSAGGIRAPDDAWPAAAEVIGEHFDWIRARIGLTVQTNEPGRSAVLFAALLWLANRSRMPIRLLEFGASAGLNLLVDRYCYVVEGRELGDPASPVRFEEPWAPGPPIDVAAAASALRIPERAGCDVAPLDPSRPEHQLRLLSYIWPDELGRIERARATLAIAARSPIRVAERSASPWLAEQLAREHAGCLTVVWHSVVRQYVPAEEWAAIESVLARAPEPTVVVSMEPSRADPGRVELVARLSRDRQSELLALCGHHGPPVLWQQPGPVNP